MKTDWLVVTTPPDGYRLKGVAQAEPPHQGLGSRALRVPVPRAHVTPLEPSVYAREVARTVRTTLSTRVPSALGTSPVPEQGRRNGSGRTRRSAALRGGVDGDHPRDRRCVRDVLRTERLRDQQGGPSLKGTADAARIAIRLEFASRQGSPGRVGVEADGETGR